MAKRTVWTFRPDATFVASRVMTLNGRTYSAGEVIDSSGLSEPRLRQLYETRWIQPMPTLTAEPVASAEPEPDPMPEPEPESPPFLESVSLPVRRHRVRSE